MNDPHLTDEWFNLISRTSLPENSDVLHFNISKQNGNAAIYLLKKKNSPHIIHSLSNFYTPIYGSTNDADIDDRKLTDLFGELKKQKNGPSIINLNPIDPQGEFYRAATTALASSGWIVDNYFCFGNWFLQEDRISFDEYLSQRPSKLRNTIKRTRKKLEASDSLNIYIIDSIDSKFDPSVRKFIDIYNNSWKKPEPYPEFIPELCRLAAEKGWLRLGILELDQQAVAAQIWLVANNTAYIVKLAYRQEYAKHGVGTVLTAQLMEHVLNIDQVSEIDYLIGDDAYKKDWTPLRRERRGIIAFNPRRIRGLTAAGKHFSGKLLRKIKPAQSDQSK